MSNQISHNGSLSSMRNFTKYMNYEGREITY